LQPPGAHFAIANFYTPISALPALPSTLTELPSPLLHAHVFFQDFW